MSIQNWTSFLWGAVGVLTATLGAVLLRDLGDTFSALANWLLRRASRRLPPHLRDRLSEEWQNELPYIFPSKFAHIRFALGCYRCAIGEARRHEADTQVEVSQPEKSQPLREISFSGPLMSFGAWMTAVEQASRESKWGGKEGRIWHDMITAEGLDPHADESNIDAFLNAVEWVRRRSGKD